MHFRARVGRVSIAVLATVGCLSSVCLADEKEQVETMEKVVVQMERLVKTASEYADALADVKDAATADRALERLAKASDAFATELDASLPIFDAAKKLAGAGRPKSSEYERRFDAASRKFKTLEREGRSQDARFARELLRIDNLEGLSSHFWDVFLINAARLNVSVSKLLVFLDEAPPIEQTQYFTDKLALYEKHRPAKVVDVILFGTKAERTLVEKSIRDALGASVSVLTNGTDGGGVVTAGPVERLDEVAAAIKVGEIIKQDATRRRITVQLPTASNLQREYARLAQLLSSDDTLGKRKAASTLLRVRPSDVANPDTRKLIARGYRSLAMEEHGMQRDKAIRGLVIWGGKHSVPILIELLDKEKLMVSSELFSALGQLPDPRSAEAVARHLGNFFNHAAAVGTLRQMGPAAEDTLIKVAPSDNPDVSLAAVQLLGDVGGEKSIPLLQKATSAHNPEVKQAAHDALKQIRLRLKSGGPTTAPAVDDPDSPFAEGVGPPVDVTAGAAGKPTQLDPNPPIIVSRQTTFITEPLRSNGLPDYEQYALKLYRHDTSAEKGPTPENNAAVLLWQAMWPGDLEPASYEMFCREIGLASVPSSQAALTPLYGNANKKRISDWLVAQGKQGDKLDPEQWISPAIDHTWTSQEFPPLAEWLNANRQPIDLILEASRRPRYYSPSPTLLDDKHDLLFSMLLPGAQSLREAARALAIRAMRHAGEGRLEEAWKDLLGVHRLSRLAAQGKTVIEQVVAMAISGIACQGTVTLLSAEHLPPELARQIQIDVRNLSQVSNVFDAISGMERLSLLDAVIHMELYGPDVLSKTNTSANSAKYPWKPGSVDWNTVLGRCNYWSDRLLAAMQLSNRNARRIAYAKFESELSADGQRISQLSQVIASVISKSRRSEIIGDMVTHLLLVGSDAATSPEDQSHTVLHLTRLAAALAVYRAEHGAYPDTLASLVPSVLKELPVDLYNAKPFIYKRTADGYLLYSAGENGSDDGGSNEKLGMVEGRTKEEGVEAHTHVQQETKMKGTDDICVRVPRPPITLPKP